MDIMQQSACLVLNSKAGPIVSQLEVFFSSDFSRGPFSLFHHSVLIGFDCFSVMIHCII